MNHGSLFSGIGGFDLASEWMGWENKFHCEWNDFGQKILKHYWPNAKSYGDITKTDFTVWRGRIDILTGGFPCQPYSMAGKRKGKADERHLWPEMLRAVREIAPNYIVGENVSGLVNWNGGMVFEEVQADLENQGYEVQPCILPACAKNAPHRRDRVWFVSRLISDTGRNGSQRDKESKEGRNDKRNGVPLHELDPLRLDGTSANTGSQQLQNRTSERNPSDKEKKRAGMDNRTERSSNFRDVTNSIGGGRLQNNKQFIPEKPEYARTSWERFPTQSPICNGNDGFSERLDGITFPKWRSESLKGGGNAIVPQVAFEIFKAIEKTENL